MNLLSKPDFSHPFVHTCTGSPWNHPPGSESRVRAEHKSPGRAGRWLSSALPHLPRTLSSNHSLPATQSQCCIMPGASLVHNWKQTEVPKCCNTESSAEGFQIDLYASIPLSSDYLLEINAKWTELILCSCLFILPLLQR